MTLRDNPFKDAMRTILAVEDGQRGEPEVSTTLDVRSAEGIVTVLDMHYVEAFALAFTLTEIDGVPGLRMDYNARGNGVEGVPRIIKNLSGKRGKSQVGWPLGRIILNVGPGQKCTSIGPTQGTKRDWRKKSLRVVPDKRAKENTREALLSYVAERSGQDARRQVEMLLLVADAAELPSGIYPADKQKAQ
jgi:hypothetical protein